MNRLEPRHAVSTSMPFRFDSVPLLDHGSLRLIETWGSDERIVEAARMSTDKGFLGWGTQWECEHGSLALPCGLGCASKERLGDEKLLAYLYSNKHDSPFEMAGFIIEVQAPIFVFREWHRHRTQSYNELSARYTPLPDVNYIPSVERLMMNAGTSNRQAGTVKGSDMLTVKKAEEFRAWLENNYREDENLYQDALKWGVPKELARLPIPVARYSRMRASANLRNWLAFLTLRSEKNPGAQWEIRQYANVIAQYVEMVFPKTYDLFSMGTR